MNPARNSALGAYRGEQALYCANVAVSGADTRAQEYGNVPLTWRSLPAPSLLSIAHTAVLRCAGDRRHLKRRIMRRNLSLPLTMLSWKKAQTLHKSLHGEGLAGRTERDDPPSATNAQ